MGRSRGSSVLSMSALKLAYDMIPNIRFISSTASQLNYFGQGWCLYLTDIDVHCCEKRARLRSDRSEAMRSSPELTTF